VEQQPFRGAVAVRPSRDGQTRTAPLNDKKVCAKQERRTVE